ncbi:MAG: DUF4340 domain-containing protein, partial [Pseudomonadota bacterium]
MSPNKRPLIYLAVAIVAALAILVIEGPERFRPGGSSENYFIPDFDSANVTRVEVDQLVDGVVLEREGEGWKVSELVTPMKKGLLEKEGRPLPETKWRAADRTRINSALGSFGGLAEGVLVSENPEKQALYQASDVLGLKVRALGAEGKPIVDVVIGKSGPDFESTYVRKAGEGRVYLVRRALVGMFSSRADDWREKKLWTIDPKTVSGVEVSSPKGSWRMTKAEGGEWGLALPAGGAFDAAAAGALAGKLSGLRAQGFADDADEKIAGLETPSLTLAVSYGADKSVKLFVGKEMAEAGKKDEKSRRYYAKLEGSGQIYLIPKSLVDS